MFYQVSPQKDTYARFDLFFHNFLLHYQHHISKNWRPILPSSYIWIFAWCAICTRFHRNNTTAEVNTTNDQNITLQQNYLTYFIKLVYCVDAITIGRKKIVSHHFHQIFHKISNLIKEYLATSKLFGSIVISNTRQYLLNIDTLFSNFSDLHYDLKNLFLLPNCMLQFSQ